MSYLLLASETQAPSLCVARGEWTTVAASDAVVTGLGSIDFVLVQLGDDPVATCSGVTCAKPASGGTITIKTWMATAAGDTAPIAATTFGKKVNWVAFGK